MPGSVAARNLGDSMFSIKGDRKETRILNTIKHRDE